jgi:hypothetical protein
MENLQYKMAKSASTTKYPSTNQKPSFPLRIKYFTIQSNTRFPKHNSLPSFRTIFLCKPTGKKVEQIHRKPLKPYSVLPDKEKPHVCLCTHIKSSMSPSTTPRTHEPFSWPLALLIYLKEDSNKT